MKKFSKRAFIAFTLTMILVLSAVGGVMAAGPNNGDCPNDCVCPCGGDGPADGSCLQTKTQANTASCYQNQNANQFNANGECKTKQNCYTYQHGYGLTD